MRAVLVLGFLVLAGCGATGQVGKGTETVRGHGLRIDLPAGWRGEIVRPEPIGGVTLRAANFPHAPLTDLGRELQLTMGERDVLVTLVHYGRAFDDARKATLPLTIDRDDFVSFEGFKRPVAMDAFALDGRAFQLWVVFRDGTPSDDVLADANRVLASIALEPRRLELAGLSVELPVRWDGFTRQEGHEDDSPAVFAANIAWPEGVAVDELARQLPRDGVAIAAVSSWHVPHEVARTTLDQPITLDNGRFLAESYEGQPARNVSTQLIFGRVGDRFLWIRVLFGRNEPDERMRADAEAVLATLRVSGPPAPPPPGWRKHHASEVGLHATLPASWHLADAPLTGIDEPREVLALATYPLAGSDRTSPCPFEPMPMPADGALIWLVEYRTDLLPSRFPRRPTTHELTRDDVRPGFCGAPLGHHATFRDADRLFQLWLLFGEQVTDVRLAEVAQILSGLSFDGLPAPPPDPYGGWPWLSTDPGDSLRVPPGWAARAGRAGELFYAANAGVVLRVVEEDRHAEGEFRPIDHEWPREHHFRPAEAAPGRRALRAGGEWQGHRFSVWIASDPDATEEDRQLALKSAASLAVSGCRSAGNYDCGDG
jgi:hypothetical protein